MLAGLMVLALIVSAGLPTSPELASGLTQALSSRGILSSVQPYARVPLPPSLRNML